jgi:hypothetical protein
MAFLIKYWADTARLGKKGHVLLEVIFFWGGAVEHCFKRNLALPELDLGP